MISLQKAGEAAHPSVEAEVHPLQQHHPSRAAVAAAHLSEGAAAGHFLLSVAVVGDVSLRRQQLSWPQGRLRLACCRVVVVALSHHRHLKRQKLLQMQCLQVSLSGAAAVARRQPVALLEEAVLALTSTFAVQ